ncbi:class I SAM-dependent methyltransferase [Actinospica sp. MGRD01-02]|uniref:Class I SAM-dependent methyltransferase n=1 Tax=Actinospica acidithermotolerans TaxID=2828514 RepID=A0A941EFJ8_9ACTN|nr:class I SAM-dependent methyltransferase [Actinospica acidithermotolerans]MBR7829808.1 class I SAM-dependent methyltransferase [Actinospica acidithermotolerans]
MTSDSVRATAFGTAAGNYDRYRVGVPDSVADRLLPTGIDAALDLGAGTGAMTRRLIGRAKRVYAVDPDPRMLAVLAESCPDVETVEGTGERIPLPDASVDAVVVASAWHWMDPDAAIPEIARVLRPAGDLIIVWNRRDRTVSWVADLEGARMRITGGDDLVEQRVRHYLDEPWLPEGAPFADIVIEDLRWQAAMSKEDIARLMTTYGGYISAPEERKPEMLRELIAYVEADERVTPADGRDDALVDVPMVCHVWRATRN